MDVNSVTAGEVEITYEAGGPDEGQPILLLHGWPDDPRTYDGVAPLLQAAGWRTIVPYLRGCGPTRFVAPEPAPAGQAAALATDVLAFMDGLGFSRLPIVGHDWGARVAYLIAAARPERAASIAALSVPWAPGPMGVPPLPQVRAFWYQWFMNTEPGAAFVRENGVAFAREQWAVWSPPGPWFTDETFARTASSFRNPDWAAVTLHFYRSRWGASAPDPRYVALEAAALAAPGIKVPTLVIHGEADACLLPDSFEGQERHFTGPYRQVRLEGVGHFPTREAPKAVADALLAHLGEAGAH
ncbi:Epoxide hydrolase A [Methylobacterium crusticola]|uniref:Epoxide hydrolase A n=1 Tax=Methylobacterium crusticola TaxID=1697972 RepID=A0ABQ4QXU0_9HYPH|nr:alpha/beta hydrolase [Methylobacterium crusticola]GJD50191.1 Epoxide hydrolase A [Methylobacterium crusticola]